ncbi:MAG: LCP family protein [Firmicutes bacterium]|nr:LCP family protein [Bacillota bacterium]
MSKYKIYLRNTLIGALAFVICFGMGVGLVGLFQGDKTTDPNDTATIVDKKRTDILLLGVDARPGETDNARSDTIILASIDPTLNRTALVSIPRDTKISGSVNSGMDKINAANVLGGPEMAVTKVEELMGEKIDYYIEVDFEGFKNIIDTLGGVTIDVDQRMYKPSEDIDLQKGVQKLNGYDALGYVRFRGYMNGDIDRTAHQQVFLKALGQELLKPATIVKLPTLIREARANVKTNLGLTDMLKIATWAPGFSGDSIVAQTLPGYFSDSRNADGVLTSSYWVADKSSLSTLLDKMLAGETVPYLVAAPAGARTTTASPPPTTAAVTTPTETEKAALERSKLPSPGHGVKI